MRAHGLGGILRVVPFAQSLLSVRAVWLDDQCFSVQQAVAHTDGVLLRLAGVCDRSSAERYRRARVCISRAELAPLEPDEYYATDLVGCDAWDSLGNRLGQIDGLVSLGAGDLLRVRTPDGDERLVPLSPGVLRWVNLVARQVLLELPEGLP